MRRNIRGDTIDEIEDFCIAASSNNTNFEGKRVSDFTLIRYKI